MDVLFCALIFIIVFHVGGAIWIYKDAEKRGDSGGLWVLLWLFFGIIAGIIWLIVRKPVIQTPMAGSLPPGWSGSSATYPLPAAPIAIAPVSADEAYDLMPYCGECGRRNEPPRRFCSACGASMSEQ